MSSLSNLKDRELAYRRIRNGTATSFEKKLYEDITGKPQTAVKRETPEQRASRLEKERIRNAKRLENETPEEQSRRKEANRIRARLRRRRRNPLPEEEFTRLKKRLVELCSYQYIVPTGWWKTETYEQYKARCSKQTVRSMKTFSKNREQANAKRMFARAIVAMEEMETIEQHQGALALFWVHSFSCQGLLHEK